jgi:hypothetical protein
MLYSKSTGGFYDVAIHGTAIPADAVEITDDLHAALMNAQSDGMRISSDETGGPIAVAPPPLAAEALLARNMGERDSLLRDAATRIAPLQDAVDLSIATPAEDAQLLLWKKYRVALNRLDLAVMPVAWPAMPET